MYQTLNIILSVVVNHGVVLPTLNVDPTSFLVPCKCFLGIIDPRYCNCCRLPSDSSSEFQSSMTMVHHKLLTREGRDLVNG